MKCELELNSIVIQTQNCVRIGKTQYTESYLLEYFILKLPLPSIKEKGIKPASAPNTILQILHYYTAG